jgi:hypothetical protein
MGLARNPTATATPTSADYSDSYEYDDFGRLSEKGGSTYTYGTSHPHAAVQASPVGVV